MNESLFSRLFLYGIKLDNRTPQEDYLTELLAWMIDNLTQFGQDYVTFLCSNSNPKIQQKEKMLSECRNSGGRVRRSN